MGIWSGAGFPGGCSDRRTAEEKEDPSSSVAECRVWTRPDRHLHGARREVTCCSEGPWTRPEGIGDSWACFWEGLQIFLRPWLLVLQEEGKREGINLSKITSTNFLMTEVEIYL